MRNEGIQNYLERLAPKKANNIFTESNEIEQKLSRQLENPHLNTTHRYAYYAPNNALLWSIKNQDQQR